MSYVNNTPQRAADLLHKISESLHDHTSTASAAIGGAGGGAAWFIKYHSALSEITIHLFSVCLYSAVGAGTGVAVKFLAERILNRFTRKKNKDNENLG